MRTLVVAIPLLAILALAVWFVVDSWAVTAGAPMPVYGWLALAGGAIVSLLLGSGLIALMYYSHRHGHDDLTSGPDHRD